MTYDEFDEHTVFKCKSCNEITSVHEEDIGIGYHEFQGVVYCDSQIVTLTFCCGSEDFEPYYEEDEASELDNPLPPVVL